MIGFGGLLLIILGLYGIKYWFLPLNLIMRCWPSTPVSLSKSTPIFRTAASKPFSIPNGFPGSLSFGKAADWNGWPRRKAPEAVLPLVNERVRAEIERKRLGKTRSNDIPVSRIKATTPLLSQLPITQSTRMSWIYLPSPRLAFSQLSVPYLRCLVKSKKQFQKRWLIRLPQNWFTNQQSLSWRWVF